MPTVEAYRGGLERAMQAGDQRAIEYFKSQIAKGEAMPFPDEKPVPQGGSIASPIAQGVTFGFADEAGGALSAALAGLRGEDMGDAYTKSRDEYREAASQYEQRHPYLSLGTELVSGLLLPGGAAKSLTRGLMAGAAAGGLTAAGKNEGDEHILSDVLAGAGLGAGGTGIAQGLMGLYRAIVPRVAARARGRDYAADVERLEQAGIPVTAGERIGQPGARAAEKQASAYLGSGEEIAARPNQLRSQIMARGGFDPEDVAAGELSDEALWRAQNHFSNEYDRILTGHTVDLQDMSQPLTALRQRFERQMLEHEQKREAGRIIDSFEDELARNQQVVNGQLTTPIEGPHYKKLSSDLGKKQRRVAAQTGENASIAPLYGELKDMLDNAFIASSPPGLARALRSTDRQYAHYAFLRDVAQNPDDLNNIANRINKSNVDRDLKRLARAYQNVIVRTGGEGAANASGQLVPPVMSMAKAAGANVAASTPRLPGPVARMTQPAARYLEGTGPWGFGQGSGMAVSSASETGKDTQRKRERRRKYDRRRDDY